MDRDLSAHAQYIDRHGPWKWILRECVRANPFYVISAALLAYGVMQLNVELDPQIGKAGGIVIGLVLLHLYELCVMGVATVVLKRRTCGGRDLHGLMLVASLFLGGSFLALDELIAIWPWLGMILVPSAVLLAAAKLAWYARLPGMLLPLSYRCLALAIIAAHSVSPLLGSPEVKLAIGLETAQSLGWFAGWLSLLGILWLIPREMPRFREETSTPELAEAQAALDPLVKRRCGGLLIAMAIATGMLHLAGSDWVFDRPADNRLYYPALTILGAGIMMLRWRGGQAMDRLNSMLAVAPAVALQWVWQRLARADANWDMALLFGPAVQSCIASVIFYTALARVTRRSEFYLGLAGTVAAPIWPLAWRTRNSVPHFRAYVSVGMGFVSLIAGMCVSLYRERLLRWLDPRKQ